MNSQLKTVHSRYSRSSAPGSANLLRSASLFALLCFSSAALTAPAGAQVIEPPLMKPGNIAVTGFSGTSFPQEGLPPGINPLDETFIDLDGKSLRIFNIKTAGGPPAGQLLNTPPPFEIEARKIGQVFGLAYDNGTLIEGRTDGRRTVANLYATASTLHGLQVVIPDNDADGRPERIKTGEPDAVFMDGQHGIELGGGPGSIYKINGVTGEVTLFANVQLEGVENSGPGLGNIAFDQARQQLFVSDLDTGMIHRFDMDGNDLGTFDHGVTGRPGNGFDAVPFDPTNRMDISNPAFDAQNPESWGFTAATRRIHGLGVKGNRLYYAVFEGLQIWSVGINRDGSFGEARWELDVASETDHPVTDIAFDRTGFLYLAQRGHVQNAYDYSKFAEPAKSQVLRYHREIPDDPATPSVWVETPSEYAIGFPQGNRMTLGGIDLGYGYDKLGNRRSTSCDGMLGTTGDNLRDNPDYADQLSDGGPFNVHGFQLNSKFLVRERNVPPWSSYFVDYDGRFDDPEVRGHVGDIEIWNPCRGGRSYGWGDIIPYPEFPRDVPKCAKVEWVEYLCNPGGIEASIWLKDNAGIDADSLKSQSATPGVSVFPPMQKRASPDDPFWLDFAGALDGQTIDLNLCLYKDADAKIPGKAFPCCKLQLPLKMPNAICGP